MLKPDQRQLRPCKWLPRDSKILNEYSPRTGLLSEEAGVKVSEPDFCYRRGHRVPSKGVQSGGLYSASSQLAQRTRHPACCLCRCLQVIAPPQHKRLAQITNNSWAFFTLTLGSGFWQMAIAEAICDLRYLFARNLTQSSSRPQ